ncbi:M14 family metallopeptidase [Pontibacter sp. G13]|uniref:M14 metallopeptidase family protein n=1 Tax=Pontibacter sp. G13 TaxID=3074898 RepID=UPI00288A4D93|nr:M14 family metallopeptidase [Pontibacter sp. G13]WNJ21187.1 M14 family metallopeptidase [Pontibacter sp. G13]
MKRFFLLMLPWICGTWAMAQTIPSPAEYLGYSLGKTYTYHHQIVSYVDMVGEKSPYVQVQSYGSTAEGRPLKVAYISSPQHLQNLDAIRTRHLQQAGIESGETDAVDLPIVWLSYNIHGNEASASEAALQTLYQLATQQELQSMLDSLIVIIDPCINPDGRDRFVNWFKQAANQLPNPNWEAYEHHEPWPGGRFNHYLFDLNRDWCWQTQKESRDRARLYQTWFPHIHVDFHEMFPNSPYYFAPAAAPYHEVITEWQRTFQTEVGKRHASYFDAQGWFYYTGESFDLLYPSYGDTWPTYQGAVGFTYEQAGHGVSGVAILENSGDTLTLADRISHHFLTGISTVESAHAYHSELISEFNSYIDRAINNPIGPYKTYTVSISETPEATLGAFCELLEHNGIEYGYAKQNTRQSGFSYQTQKTETVSIQAGDLVISAYQAQSNLLRVLLEPSTMLEDSVTYDLTAWALPYAYDLHAYALPAKLTPSAQRPFQDPAGELDAAYAYAFRWNSAASAQFLAQLSRSGIMVKQARVPFEHQGERYPNGTMVIPGRILQDPAVRKSISQLAQSLAVPLIPIETGFTDAGPDLGSDTFSWIGPKSVAIVRGKGVNPTSFGEVWHLFEAQIQYPTTVIDRSYFAEADLSQVQVLILADGNYRDLQPQLLAFAQNGGTIIAMEGAIGTFTHTPEGANPPTMLASAIQAQEALSQELETENGSEPSFSELPKYGEQDRNQISDMVAGSIYQIALDPTNPLAYGQDESTFLLKRNSSVYPFLSNGGWTAGAFTSGDPIAGFTGASLREEIGQTMAIGMEPHGRGKIIYFTDSPIIRGFWNSGVLLMANAVFMP